MEARHIKSFSEINAVRETEAHILQELIMGIIPMFIGYKNML